MLGGDVSLTLRLHEPEWFWGDVLPIVQQADGVFANLEGPITESKERWKGGWKMYHFRATPAAVRILQCAGVRFVCLANNHMLDFSETGLLDTMAVLDRADISYAGAGRDLSEASAPRLLRLPGMTVGLIAATDTMRGFAAGHDRPGTHVVRFSDDAATMAWIDRSMCEMRSRGADFFVLTLHWGPNMRTKPPQRFRRFAHAAIERGVSVIHGHSAHVVQAVERYRNGVILYDTGNCIDDYWKFPFRDTTSSFVFLLDIEDQQPRRLRMVPVRQDSVRLGLATGKSKDQIKQRMMSICSDLGTAVLATAEGLELPLRATGQN